MVSNKKVEYYYNNKIPGIYLNIRGIYTLYKKTLNKFV
ncbi:hypothetical protein NIAS840_00541 [Ligilactobacillus salivarius NIAS840]|uniref:Uncharacterized protein n=1 Tax=Ligilactobacillus salivarius NIAS840 TaxID=1029822 RepID=F5VDB3_9LACO|nr:hypothetical protein NIAS840_00541 [Ligilactobacillus salivarius NIAS840]